MYFRTGCKKQAFCYQRKIVVHVKQSLKQKYTRMGVMELGCVCVCVGGGGGNTGDKRVGPTGAGTLRANKALGGGGQAIDHKQCLPPPPPNLCLLRAFRRHWWGPHTCVSIISFLVSCMSPVSSLTAMPRGLRREPKLATISAARAFIGAMYTIWDCGGRERYCFKYSIGPMAGITSQNCDMP